MPNTWAWESDWAKNLDLTSVDWKMITVRCGAAFAAKIIYEYKL
jgi:hypothetical protein